VDWYRAEDAWSLWRAVEASRKTLVPWLPWAADGHRTPEDSLAVIDRFARDRAFPEGLDFVMGIFDRRSGEVVGGTGLHRIQPETADAEIGYWVREDRRGEGLCTEAVGALVTAALSAWGFRRVRVCCSDRNVPSRRVPERLGLRLECEEREARFVDGIGWTGSLAYAVLASEWDGARQRVRGAGLAPGPPPARS
jgi:RimJ/RimL family protein N-acetyltransferase